MKNMVRSLVSLWLLMALGTAIAQTPPVLSTEKDTDGKPLPFGRQPYKPRHVSKKNID
jgi:hypothetical protein